MTAADAGAMRALADATIDALPSRPAVRTDADTRLGAVVDAMHRGGRGAVLVEGDGALVGIFTERDLLDRVDVGDPAWTELLVRDVMSPYPMVVRHDDSLAEALRRLLEVRRRHLPVLDERGHVLGVISIRDILSYIASRFPDELVNLPPVPEHAS